MANCFICYQDAGDQSYHNPCAKKFFGTSEAPTLEFNQALLKELAGQTVNQRIAITGVQPKISVTLEKHQGAGRLTIVGLWGEYILKPQHGSLPSMPETEDLTMHLATIFGVEVCEHSLLPASDGSLVYLAKRFDRQKNKKIHVEDFCQLSEFLTEQKYKGSYERAGKLILRYCTNTGLDIIKYFELLLFSFLTGNNDMHLKNFSLIHREKSIDLSPAYDLLNVHLVFPEDQEETALMLNGRKKNIHLRDFEALGKVLEIPGRVRKNSYKKFTSHSQAVQKMIQASFLPHDMQEIYWQIWNKKQRIFEDLPGQF